MSEEVVVVLTTVPDQETADRLAQAILDARLAACIQVAGAVRSVYDWRGARQVEAEIPLVIKTFASKLAQLETFVSARHPYDVPEFVAVPARFVSTAYQAWMTEEMTRDADSID